MKKYNIFLISLFLLFVNLSSYANELDKLFLKLKNAENFSEARNIEKKNMEYLGN